MSEARRSVLIVNERGLHARASRMFVTRAAEFDATVRVRCDGHEVSADSVLSLLECAAGVGCEIEILAEGEDADAAVAALSSLVEAGFYEGDRSE